MPYELRARVARKESIALDITLFELVHGEGMALPAFSAGAHINVQVPGGLTRQYSLCNDPAEVHRYQIAVLKDAKGRGGSRAMHEQLREGEEIVISAPRNHFEIVTEAQTNVLLAGGIGITPLLCMAERLSAIGRPFELHYCTRSEDRTAFRDRIAASRYARQVRFYFDDDAFGRRIDLAAVLQKPVPGTHLYTCGPRGFMDAVLSTARQNNWTECQLHHEFFDAQTARHGSDVGFEVQLASSGRVIRVEPQQTVIVALSAHGVEIPVSCEQGVCGTCLTRVLAGLPDHQDFFLTPQEQSANDQFLPCCSRAKSPRLVLDL